MLLLNKSFVVGAIALPVHFQAANAALGAFFCQLDERLRALEEPRVPQVLHPRHGAPGLGLELRPRLRALQIYKPLAVETHCLHKIVPTTNARPFSRLWNILAPGICATCILRLLILFLLLLLGLRYKLMVRKRGI
ncbi:hypothetical protein FB451DRAFT_1555809 [Mycena latifolia]|nr:hypothetical protein FB451DRAFT_1555809 [Mycena latifolia]